MVNGCSLTLSSYHQWLKEFSRGTKGRIRLMRQEIWALNVCLQLYQMTKVACTQGHSKETETIKWRMIHWFLNRHKIQGFSFQWLRLQLFWPRFCGGSIHSLQDRWVSFSVPNFSFEPGDFCWWQQNNIMIQFNRKLKRQADTIKKDCENHWHRKVYVVTLSLHNFLKLGFLILSKNVAGMLF